MMRKFVLVPVALLMLGLNVAAYAGSYRPGRVIESVAPHSVDRYTETFRAGERAIVAAIGDGSTDLDLYVYDQNGNLIAADEDGTDDCVVSFVPRWTGPFTIRVVNRGMVTNTYAIGVN